jgi:hypothetical protein
MDNIYIYIYIINVHILKEDLKIIIRKIRNTFLKQEADLN